jgi:hypothetical protein
VNDDDQEFVAPTDPAELDKRLHGIVMIASSEGDWYYYDAPAMPASTSNGVPPVFPRPDTSPKADNQ